MLLSERRWQGALSRRSLAVGLVLATLVASGCTVRPLYSDLGATTGALPSPAARLSSVSVRPESTRYGLEVRNHLIFLLNGGAAEPASPAYTLRLGVTSQIATTAIIQQTTDSEPTARSVTLTSTYSLVDNATGKIVAAGRRNISSSYDIPRQEFAALRAERDAQNRAARELAELLRHAVALDLERLSAG